MALQVMNVWRRLLLFYKGKKKAMRWLGFTDGNESGAFPEKYRIWGNHR